jgi:hypothetical protein
MTMYFAELHPVTLVKALWPKGPLICLALPCYNDVNGVFYTKGLKSSDQSFGWPFIRLKLYPDMMGFSIRTPRR